MQYMKTGVEETCDKLIALAWTLDITHDDRLTPLTRQSSRPAISRFQQCGGSPGLSGNLKIATRRPQDYQLFDRKGDRYIR